MSKNMIQTTYVFRYHKGSKKQETTVNSRYNEALRTSILLISEVIYINNATSGAKNFVLSDLVITRVHCESLPFVK